MPRGAVRGSMTKGWCLTRLHPSGSVYHSTVVEPAPQCSSCKKRFKQWKLGLTEGIEQNKPVWQSSWFHSLFEKLSPQKPRWLNYKRLCPWTILTLTLQKNSNQCYFLVKKMQSMLVYVYKTVCCCWGTDLSEETKSMPSTRLSSVSCLPLVETTTM